MEIIHGQSTETEQKKRLIVGISGASGVIMGYRLLEALRAYPDYEIHLVITEGAKRNFALETDLSLGEVEALGDYVYDDKDFAAAIASGSFLTEGMIVLPCSMKSLSAIANGYSATLLVRAADCCLKEGRPVVLVTREMPLNRIQVKNMLAAMEAGCAIVPPMLTFYHGASSLEEQIDHVVGKVLMQFGLSFSRFRPWNGPPKA